MRFVFSVKTSYTISLMTNDFFFHAIDSVEILIKGKRENEHTQRPYYYDGSIGTTTVGIKDLFRCQILKRLKSNLPCRLTVYLTFIEILY